MKFLLSSVGKKYYADETSPEYFSLLFKCMREEVDELPVGARAIRLKEWLNEHGPPRTPEEILSDARQSEQRCERSIEYEASFQCDRCPKKKTTREERFLLRHDMTHHKVGSHRCFQRNCLSRPFFSV